MLHFQTGVYCLCFICVHFAFHINPACVVLSDGRFVLVQLTGMCVCSRGMI